MSETVEMATYSRAELEEMRDALARILSATGDGTIKTDLRQTGYSMHLMFAQPTNVMDMRALTNVAHPFMVEQLINQLLELMGVSDER